MHRSTLKIIALCFYGMCSFALVGNAFHHAFAKEATLEDPVVAHNEKPPPSDEAMLGAMKKYLGVPYKRAGASKKGFDCSGFVKVVYEEVFGVRLPHQSSQQSHSPQLVDASMDSLITGDLVFFSTSGRNRAINHVGIYLGGGRFIHAAQSSGVVVSELEEPYWRSKIIGAKRLAKREPVQAERTSLDLAFSFDRRNAIFFRFERNETVPSAPFLFENRPVAAFSGHESHRLELDYVRAIHPSVISHFTAFRETLLCPKEEGRLVPGPFSGGVDLFENSGAYAQGVRLAGDLRSLGGLFVSPSISYFDYGPSVLDSGLPRVVAGLHLGLIPQSKDWALSSTIRMPLGRSPFSLLEEGFAEHAMDISLTYRQRVSGRMELSLSGEKFMGFVPPLKGADSLFERDDERLTLMLHFFY